MQKAKDKTGPNTGMKFVVSCGYFNNSDEKTHTTDFIVDLIQETPARSDYNQSMITSAA
jgi:hypothetical protein